MIAVEPTELPGNVSLMNTGMQTGNLWRDTRCCYVDSLQMRQFEFTAC